MQFSLETIAALATIVGTLAAVLALIQSSAWLVLVSLVLVCLAIVSGLYARRERSILNSASTVIEGHSIDSLNVANLRRRVNRNLTVQEVHHTVRIVGEDMEITWKYTGFCKADAVSTMEFSIDSDENTSFEKLKCVAFDLGHDPEMSHEIYPVLIGTEGISKKVSVTFLELMKANQSFGVQMSFTLPRCVKAGFGYYTSTSSFAQAHVQHYVVRLIFEGTSPQWVRVYESTARRPNKLIKTLPPISRSPDSCEYVDIVDDRQGKSARVYAFWRDSL